MGAPVLADVHPRVTHARPLPRLQSLIDEPDDEDPEREEDRPEREHPEWTEKSSERG